MTPDPQQEKGYRWLTSKPRAALWWRAGEGKTFPTLLAMWARLATGQVSKILVVGTRRIAEDVWPVEAEKISNLYPMNIGIATGPPAERMAVIEDPQYDVITINNEKIAWLVDTYRLNGKWPFDMLVLDESSFYSKPGAKRVKKLKLVQGMFKSIIELTGSPHAEKLLQVWSQIYLLDRGERLGTTFGSFKMRYFAQDPNNTWNQWPIKGARDFIYDKVSDLTLVAKENRRGRSAPLERDVTMELSPKLQAHYDQFVKDAVMEWRESVIDGKTAAVLLNKLLQFANGFIYDEDRNPLPVHDMKLKWLRETVDEMQGEPLLVVYKFRHDVERIQSIVPEAQKMGPGMVEAWNDKSVPVMLVHPQSAGHGLNLQHGGSSVVFYSLPWSLEQYEQTVARLDRRGQANRVLVQRLVTIGTADEKVRAALQRKNSAQQYLFNYMTKLAAA